ncbi:MAG: hypothetical protein KKD32_07000 [Proteobacteria bacterium]|nr:hypothetical protein [Pseudomonadota bacterium]
MNKKIRERISKIRRDGIFFGILTIFIGYLALTTGYSRGGVVTPSASWVIISIGVFIIIYSIFRKLDPVTLKAEEIPKAKICVNCGTIYQSQEITLRCNKCHSELEDTKDFLERHPDYTQQVVETIKDNEPNPFLLVFKVISIAIITSIIGVIFFKYVAENL